jgi:hypothetical protein
MEIAKVIVQAPAPIKVVTQPAGIPMPGNGIGNSIWNEVPAGALNGSNAIFRSDFPFAPESLQVFVNGQLQKLTSDYTILNSRDIQFYFSPQANESILIHYQKI